MSTLRRLHDAPTADLALAVVLGIAGAGAILTGEVDEGSVWITLPVVAVTAGAVAVRRRWTLVSAAAVTAATMAQATWGDRSPGTLMALVTVLVVAYSTGAESEEGSAGVGLAVLLLGQFYGEWRDHGSDYPFIVIELGGVWLLGRAARSLRSRASHAEQRQRELARLAVAEERARIARELHDVVAHGLSVIAVQADAAEATLARDPGSAASALRVIQGSAREALADMRQLLHVLRAEEPGEQAPREPARGLADLPGLVAAMLDAGLPLRASVEPGLTAPAGIELAVFRIAQEGLTNVLRHAGPVPTTLEVRRAGGALVVRVRNSAPSTDALVRGPRLSTGHGLIGVRERVLAAGGSLSADRTPDGGFELTAELPLPEAAGS